MKVGIITFHFVNNYGGALQAYALQRAVAEKCDVETIMIDYRNSFICFTDTVRIMPVVSNTNEIKSGLKTIKYRIERIKKFKQFIKQNTKLTRRYYLWSDLRKNTPECDKYICGSDQIWNPFLTFGLSEPYFLGFVREKEKKISYAPSFGTKRIAPYFQSKIRKYLESFSALSVREKEGIKLIEELTGKKAVQLIDPTFLLPQTEWEKIATDYHDEGGYILLYIMQNDMQMYEHARLLKEKLGKKVIEISRYGYSPDFVDETIIDAGPSEFLGLFKNADYICTNSYHGFAFSILFHKELCLVPCKRFHSRIKNLAELLEIDLSRTGKSYEPYDVVYDREHVDGIIKEECEKSFHYIKKSLNMV